MKKFIVALGLVLSFSVVSALQAQMRLYNANLVKFGNVNVAPTITSGMEINMSNFLFKGDSVKFSIGEKYLLIRGESMTGTLNTGAQTNVIGGGGGVLYPSAGSIKLIGSHNQWDIGSSSNKVNTIYATLVNAENLNKTSDRRYKTNIADLMPAMEKIMRLRPVSFDYREGKDGERSTEPGRQNRVGLIAQELLDVIPEAVCYMEQDDIYTVDYTTLIPFLIKAAQEQQALIKEQQLQIEELQALVVVQNDNPATPDATLNSVRPKDAPAETVVAAEGNRLWSNVPNPFKQETRIRYALNEDVREAQLCIYNLSGQQLSCHRLNDRGESEFVLRAASIMPGIYLYSLIADGKVVDTHRMVVTE